MLAETDALPLGFVAIVPPADVDLGGPEQVVCRAAVVVGDGFTFPVTVPRSTLRPIHLDRAAGLLETWAEQGLDVTVATAGYPDRCGAGA